MVWVSIATHLITIHVGEKYECEWKGDEVITRVFLFTVFAGIQITI